MGRWAVAPGPGNLIADDLSVTSSGACRPTRIEFEVTGRVDPDGVDGPYEVEFGLYTTCPGAVSPSILPNRQLAGAVFSFEDDLPRRVVFNVPDGVTIPTNVWLGLTFSRANAGVIVGAPPQEGFSQDMFDFPGWPCTANFGGFPEQPHGSFNLDIWGDEATCPASRIGYLRRRESGSNATNTGANEWIVENVNLIAPGCQMIAYEIVIHGHGVYHTEFRTSCAGGQIPNTFKQLFTDGPNMEARSIRLVVDPPVNLPQNFWFAARVPLSNAGVVSPGIDPAIGQAGGSLARDLENGTCEFPASGIQETGLSLTVICAGAAQLGACCDMYVKECVGGAGDGSPCGNNADCESPGTCEVPCRQLAQANCSFPAPGQLLFPTWEAGDACNPNPFPGGIVCGRAACCHVDQWGYDTCLNRTENECAALGQLGGLGEWQLGKYCGLFGQLCPFAFCPGIAGDCFQPHSECGCENEGCCERVCKEIFWSWDPWLGSPWFPCFEPLCYYSCCPNGWDSRHVSIALDVCDSFVLRNDDCFDSQESWGAHTIHPSYGAVAYVSDGTRGPDDPKLCCAAGTLEQSGDRGLSEAGGDAPEGSVWFKFVAPPGPAARITACPLTAQSPGVPVVQILAPRDRGGEQAACESLTVIACSDGGTTCNSGSAGATLCVAGLTPGETYYAVVGAKSKEDATRFHVSVHQAQDCPILIGNDQDGDGDVDLRDAAGVMNCYAGEGEPQGCCGLLDVPPYNGRIGTDEVRTLVEGMDGPG